MASNYVNQGSVGQYGGDFYWSGGSSLITPGETNAGFSGMNSPDFGWLMVCGKSPCTQASAYIAVDRIGLDVRETSGPSLSSPSGLWQSDGWIRGDWNLPLSGDSPSGVCSLNAQLAGQALPGSSVAADQSQWHQCAGAALNDTAPTAAYPQGGDTLTISGSDAAGVPIALSKTVYAITSSRPSACRVRPTPPRRSATRP